MALLKEVGMMRAEEEEVRRVRRSPARRTATMLRAYERPFVPSRCQRKSVSNPRSFLRSFLRSFGIDFSVREVSYRVSTRCRTVNIDFRPRLVITITDGSDIMRLMSMTLECVCTFLVQSCTTMRWSEPWNRSFYCFREEILVRKS